MNADGKGEAGGKRESVWENRCERGKGEPEPLTALNPPVNVSWRSLSHPPTMSSSAIYAVSIPRLLFPLSLLPFSPISYTAQEPSTYCPAHSGPLPTAFAHPSLRMFRYHQIRVRCPFTGHRSPPQSAG